MNNLQITKKFTDWMNEGFCGKRDLPGFQITRPLVLEDGTELSIQAGRSHYCSPKQDAPVPDYDFYDAFEIGFPTKVIEETLEYAEDPEEPEDTVYAMVPKELIERVIEKRGGVVGIGG